MIVLLHHLLSTLASPLVALGFFLHSRFTRHKREHLGEHFGAMPQTPAGKETLWLHALSLGEVVSAGPVLKEIRALRPEARLVVSVTTDSGYEGAKQHLPMADLVVFHPLDCWPFTQRALDTIQPDVFVLTDTGFWPGLLAQLKQRGVPALLFNGRISRRSLRRYKMLGGLARSLLGFFDQLCMQDAQGQAAAIALGADPERVRVLGDPKYDAVTRLSEDGRTELRDKLKIRPNVPVIVAGSTHAGEEEIVLSAYRSLKVRDADLVLILAPRRKERVAEVASLLVERNVPFTLRSRIGEDAALNEDVILVDTLGELASLYSIASVAFVGNSLLPPGGGHSLIEPLSYAVPTLHGPFIENIRHVAGPLKEAGLAYPVETPGEMQETLQTLLWNRDDGQRAERALALMKEYQGASRRMAELVLKLLAPPNA